MGPCFSPAGVRLSHPSWADANNHSTVCDRAVALHGLQSENIEVCDAFAAVGGANRLAAPSARPLPSAYAGLAHAPFADRGLTSRAPRQLASCGEFGKTPRHLSGVTPENEWCCSRPCEQHRAPIAWVVAEETEKWTKVIRAANIAVE